MSRNRKNRMSAIELTASTLSVTTGKPWYIMKKEGAPDKAMTEDSLKRFMQLGYKVDCVYYEGERHRNLYMLEGRLQFVM